MRPVSPLLFLVLLLSSGPVMGGPLHDAAMKGDVEAIAAVLDAGTKINEIGGPGEATALYFAVLNGHAKAAEFLIARGADLNLSSRFNGPPLFRAAWKANAEMMTLLLANGANPHTAFGSETALHTASDSGCLVCVKLLLNAGADVNVTNKRGHRPIHYAVARGHQN